MTTEVLVSSLSVRAGLGALPEGAVLVTEPGPRVELLLVDPVNAAGVGSVVPLLPSLRVVQSTQAGVDWLLPQVPPSVTVCAANGAHDIAVSEWVVAVVLAMRRHLPEFLDRQRAGVWDSGVNPMSAPGGGTASPALPADLDGSDVLIIGFGSIGRAVAQRLTPFGARVQGIARRARPGVATMDDLPVLLPRADVVVVLAPLTPATSGLVDAGFLARMKPGATLVNAARGPIVDTGALLEALHAGTVRAALDVSDPEPLPEGHPLWTAPGVLITPHVAGSTRDWLARAYALAGDQIRRFVAGEELLNQHAGESLLNQHRGAAG